MNSRMVDGTTLDLTVPANLADHALGTSRASAVLVEYGDFECPNCKQAAPVVKLLLARFADRIRFVYRHFPLEEVHPHALHAALAAEAAAAQHKFWPMHDLLFERQGDLKLNQLRTYAQKLELDIGRYDSDMKDLLYLQRIREHIDSGRRSGVRATPTFFINNRIHDVSYGFQSLHDRVKLEL
ncbi:MAG TPA: DsbA family protein [Burkholderiaceae bacterium]|nr:DsbA family protein [Burkholderiaceae bacterium]